MLPAGRSPHSLTGGPIEPLDAGLREALRAAVLGKVIPGAALAAGIGGRTVVRMVSGSTAAPPEAGVPVGPATVFDLASLTKVMATTPAVLALSDQGRLALSDPVGRCIPAFSDGRHEGVRLEHLLTHTAGLRDSRRFYREWSTSADVLAAVVAEPAVAAPGERVVYSDLGFLLLGHVVEVVTGMRLDAACAALVHQPLALNRTAYRPMDRAELAGGPFAVTTEPGAPPVTGLPHDRNAQACGGVAGHAGLFSTLDDVAAYAAWWAGTGGGPVAAGTRTVAMRCATEGLGGRRGLGWVTRGDDADFLGDGWSSAAVTHTGFTGTSIAVDPSHGWWACLLTNAIHLGRDRPEVGALRTELHELLVPLLSTSG